MPVHKAANAHKCGWKSAKNEAAGAGDPLPPRVLPPTVLPILGQPLPPMRPRQRADQRLVGPRLGRLAGCNQVCRTIFAGFELFQQPGAPVLAAGRPSKKDRALLVTGRPRLGRYAESLVLSGATS
jgi:hypothetical protein